MAEQTTIESGFELIKKLKDWSPGRFKTDTLFCTIDVADLYTMIPQTEGVLSLRKMLNCLNLKQVDGLKIETIIRLSRFVMQNNYFSFDGQFYHQKRGGAMGSPLTLTIANCYMFFFERQISKQVNNSGGLFLRYIDDLFLVINWPERHLLKQIEKWNQIDQNIKLQAHIGHTTNFLDLYMQNDNGVLVTCVFHKPSYEPYYLPFNSIHPMHMKKNIAFAMCLRTIRYCSSFQSFINERESLRMALLLNKYPEGFINRQFELLFEKFKIKEQVSAQNYQRVHSTISSSPQTKIPVNDENNIFIHFTYCSNMRTFPIRFHALWEKYFSSSPIGDINPILGTRNVKNLQRRMTYTRV